MNLKKIATLVLVLLVTIGIHVATCVLLLCTSQQVNFWICMIIVFRLLGTLLTIRFFQVWISGLTVAIGPAGLRGADRDALHPSEGEARQPRTQSGNTQDRCVGTKSVSGSIGLNLGFCGSCVLFSIIEFSSSQTIPVYLINIQTTQFILLMVIMCFFDQLLEKIISQDYHRLVRCQTPESLGILAYNDDCSVCLCIIETDEACVLYCNHVFHHECIKKWLIFSSTCPLCRDQVVHSDIV